MPVRRWTAASCWWKSKSLLTRELNWLQGGAAGALKLLSATLLVVMSCAPTATAETESESDQPRLPCTLQVVFESFSGLILVPVTIDGSPPLDFVLDSGASSSAITDPFLAEALGLEFASAGLARGAGAGATEVRITDEVSIASQGFEILRVPLVVHDIGVLIAGMAGRDLDGFLGSEVFLNYVVEVDPGSRRLVLHDPLTFSYEGGGLSMPLEVVSGRPVVEARVVLREGRKPLPVRLLLDTGSNRVLTLIRGSKRQLRPSGATTREDTIGVTGSASVEIGPIESIDMGGVLARRIEVAWMEEFRVAPTRTIPGLNGIVGNGLLSRFRAIYDYRGGRLILEPLD